MRPWVSGVPTHSPLWEWKLRPGGKWSLLGPWIYEEKVIIIQLRVDKNERSTPNLAGKEVSETDSDAGQIFHTGGKVKRSKVNTS